MAGSICGMLQVRNLVIFLEGVNAHQILQIENSENSNLNQRPRGTKLNVPEDLSGRVKRSMEHEDEGKSSLTLRTAYSTHHGFWL